MWTAVRLLAVCALGVSGLFALRSGLPSHQKRPPPPPIIHADIGAFDVAAVTLVTEEDNPPSTDENSKKVVTVEKVRVAALNANDQAPSQPEAKPYRRPHLHSHRRQRRRHHHH